MIVLLSLPQLSYIMPIRERGKQVHVVTSKMVRCRLRLKDSLQEAGLCPSQFERLVRKGCCAACKPSQIVDLRWKSGESHQLIVTESEKFLHLSRVLD
jgi:hypothetical protein